MYVELTVDMLTFIGKEGGNSDLPVNTVASTKPITTTVRKSASRCAVQFTSAAV
jgi:hypothetical protein